MRSTITRSLAAVTLGAALTLAPVGVAFADGHIAPEPDLTLPNQPELNQPETFEAWLLSEYDIVATCEKIEPVDDPFIVPPQPSEDEEWSLVVVKGGSGDAANELWFYPQPGWELSHATAGNSHVIVCTSDVEDEETTTSTTTTHTTTTTTTTTTPVTGPVVETDRPAGGDYGQLGLFAGAAVALAAAGGLALNRRRQSAEH